MFFIKEFIFYTSFQLSVGSDPVMTGGIFQLEQNFHPFRCYTPLLTVAAERPPIGGHGAVTGEALPQLQTHSLVVAGVLCAGGAGTYRV